MNKICTLCGMPITRGQSKIQDFEGLNWHLHCKRKALAKQNEPKKPYDSPNHHQK